jgi:nucleoside-diphosphate-sugar epimerase
VAERKRVLLTGSAGRIGRALTPWFREWYDTCLFDRHPTPGFPEAIVGDLSDLDGLKRAMEGVDTLVHLAACPGDQPFLSVLVPDNIVGVYNAFEAAKQAGVRRIVFASTVQTVREYPKEYEIQINDFPRPNTIYGATKAFAEAVGRWYYETHGIEFVGLRIGGFRSAAHPPIEDPAKLYDMWLSERDAVGIFRAAIDKPTVGYAVVFAVSRGPKDRVSVQPLRDYLDYEPQDDERFSEVKERVPIGEL